MARAMSESENLPRQQMFIDGEWTDSASGEYFESFDPFTAKAWTLVPRGNAEDVDRAVQAAHRAFTSGEWPKMHASQRGQLLRRLGDLIARDAEEIAAIEVQDNGIGIAPHDIERALEPFSQVDSGLNRKYPGTGLGLPLTKLFVELHGGSMTLESALGEGTKVSLSFPAWRFIDANKKAV